MRNHALFFGGSMRDWLNAILATIGTTSMTDVEYGAINALGLTVNDYNQAAYDQLAALLISRESISNLQEKLIAFFVVKGLNVNPAKVGKSDILLGAVL